MTEKAEVTISVMPKVEERVVELSQKLEEIARERAPEAWDAALAVVQVNALQELVTGALFLLVAIASFFIGKLFQYEGDRCKASRTHAYAEDGVGFYITAAVIWAAGGASGFAGSLFLANVWVYTALLHPELAIAKRILEGIL